MIPDQKRTCPTRGTPSAHEVKADQISPVRAINQCGGVSHVFPKVEPESPEEGP